MRAKIKFILWFAIPILVYTICFMAIMVPFLAYNAQIRGQSISLVEVINWYFLFGFGAIYMWQRHVALLVINVSLGIIFAFIWLALVQKFYDEFRREKLRTRVQTKKA